jgi:CHAT domain-containing protein
VWRGRFAPAEPALRGVEDLVAVLSPWMARVPLDVFVDDRGRPLADRFAVSYIQSPSLYVDRTEGARLARQTTRPTTALFIDGALPARTGPDEGRIGIPARFAGPTRVPAGSAAEPLLHGRWNRDHAARQPPPGLVQFDGHSLIDYRLPGGSALVLDAEGRGMKAMSRPARPGDPYVDDANDGLLTMTEIEKLDLPAELVVLASCQSAGRYDYGAFVGIGEAFLRAGSRSVLTSLWPVDERATVELLRRFYGRAYGEDGRPRRSFARALREARLELRGFVAADGSRPYAHPAYWAPFVLVGDRGIEPEASKQAVRIGVTLE